jgi:formylglycine-generating enzyme required for sulfatase activity
MKSTIKRFDLIAFIAVILFITAACSKAAAQSAPDTRSKVPEIPGMVWIPAGTFTMGSPTNEPGRHDDETQHQVRLTKGFYLGKYPVTQAQYQAVMKTNPSFFKSSSCPVEQVSWYDAIVFCNRLSMEEGLNPAYRINGSTNPSAWGNVPEDYSPTWNNANATWDAVELVAGSNGYRLPTEAQWEYACRAGTKTAFNWGTDTISSSGANYNANYVDANNTAEGTYLQRTTEVGSYASNAWGLYDMHGNVGEWCWDRYRAYSSGAQTDPTGAVSGYSRVVRSGSWNDWSEFLRSAYRNGSDPHGGWNGFGFRLVRP